MSIELPTIIEKITYQKDTFCILAANLDPYSSRYKPEMEEMVKDAINSKYDTFTIKVCNMMSPIDNISGGQYIFIGDFEYDPKRGKQFKSEYYYLDAPNTEEGLRSFLMTLPNIKEMRSQAIIKKFGLEGALDVLDNHPEKLIEISGINAKRIPAIKKEWDEKKYLRTFYEWLLKNNVSVGIADKAFKMWKNKSIEILTANPYRLVELRGIGFVTADRLAHQILSDVPQNFRMKACIQFVLGDQLLESNLCVTYPNLKKHILVLLAECDKNLGKDVSVDSYIPLVSSTLKENLDVFAVIKDIEEQPSMIYIYLKKIWDQEQYISNALVKMNDNKIPEVCSDADIKDAEKNLCIFSKRDIKLDETQKQAIKSALNNSVTVITGPAGSGKSCISRCIVYLANKKHITIRLMSPTGKAAQVLSEKTGFEATTIHRALKMKPGCDFPGESIYENTVIIDEISMCGIDTFYSFLVAMENLKNPRLIMIGDKNQLPSVSPGNFLTDIINSKCANVITLDTIHRQDENSFISIVANDISKGKMTTIPAEATDIKWHDLDADTVQKDVVDFIDKYMNDGNDMDDLQFLSPMKKGSYGVFMLNQIIQTRMAEINRHQDKMLQVGFHKFYLGDRVMQVENNYEKDVFNGDIGKIVDLGDKVLDPMVNDKKTRYITVDFLGKRKMYKGNEVDELMACWCCTIHKYQGSQIANVVMFMGNEQQVLVSKELIYTAFSRSSKHLDIFGHLNMLRLAPSRSAIRKRYTNVVKIIKGIRCGKSSLIDLKQEKQEKNNG